MFKVAVVGCGAIAQHKYLPILRGLKDRVNLVGLCELNRDVLKQAASKFHVTHAYTDVASLFAEQRPDVVIVLTPPKTHADLVISALAAGAHVLVEKPMAANVADCDRMNEAAAAYGRRLGVMHSQLFHPPLDQVRREVVAGRYGRFLGVRIFLATGRYEWIAEPSHWAHKLRGGAVGEIGPHAVYLSLAFLENVREVHVGMAKHDQDSPWLIADDITIDLIADNGISSVGLDFASHQTTAEVDIICAQQILKVDLQSRIAVKHNRLVTRMSAVGVGKSVLSAAYQRVRGLTTNMLRYRFSSKLDGHYVGINKFLDYVSGDETFPATGIHGRQTTAVLDKIVDKLEVLRLKTEEPSPASLNKPNPGQY